MGNQIIRRKIELAIIVGLRALVAFAASISNADETEQKEAETSELLSTSAKD